MKIRGLTFSGRQSGFTLIELMVALLITVTVLSGVVQMLVVSKSSFIAARELATTQENARYAMKFIVDEVRMAGFTGCTSTPAGFTNSVIGSTDSWYLDNPGIRGYEHEAGIGNFPSDFRDEMRADTDALVVRRSEATGLRVTDDTGATFHLNEAHAYKPGEVMVITTPDCQQVGVFQITSPANITNNATTMVHNAGAAVSPGNCEFALAGYINCPVPPGPPPVATPYPDGSSIRELRSEAYYIGPSITDSTVPALFRESMQLISAGSLATSAEELVKGVENMQLFYGLDNLNGDGIADRYVKANDAALDWNSDGVRDWDRVVSVRLSLRMRSLLPVYNEPVAFGTFEGAAGTDGSDRFMRQDISTTITLRNP